MKEKLKEFFIQKRELLLFIGVLLVVFTTVIVVANYALSETPAPKDQDPPVVIPGGDGDDEDPVGGGNDGDDEDPVVNEVSKVIVPVDGDFVMVRLFFDTDMSVEELVKAVINTGNNFIESQGISYAKSDNSVFDVYTILPGEVINVQTDSLEGTIITIQHEDSVISRYYSLSNANVSIGDVLAEKTVIGKAGTSILDNEAGVHVHLEILLGDEYINPQQVIGKETNEITSNK